MHFSTIPCYHIAKKQYTNARLEIVETEARQFKSKQKILFMRSESQLYLIKSGLPIGVKLFIKFSFLYNCVPLKLVSTIFCQILIFHQPIALQKL